MTAQIGGIFRRDYVVLPLLSLVTILLMLGIAETATRLIYPEQQENPCVIGTDSSDPYRLKPNCTVRTKAAEGPWTVSRFNDCGYRSETSCGPVAPGTRRIAIVGSSVSQGYDMPYDDTYFSVASQRLRQLCSGAIDVQNLGKPASTPLYAYRKMDEALNLKPDVVLWLLAPFDMEQQIDPQALAARDLPAQALPKSVTTLHLSAMKRIQQLILSSRTVLVAEHFLLQNRDTFIRLYMNYGDKADFLRQPFTPAWQRRFADMDVIIGGMAEKARAAGVPLIVIPVPSRVQAALLSAPQRPPGVDPAAFGITLEDIAAKHGAGFVDLMQPFATHPDSQDLFFVVDGHVAERGQRFIGELLTRKLTDGSIPAFAQCKAAATDQPETR